MWVKYTHELMIECFSIFSIFSIDVYLFICKSQLLSLYFNSYKNAVVTAAVGKHSHKANFGFI